MAAKAATKTRRTFWAVVLGGEPVPGAKKGQELKDTQKHKESGAAMLSKLLETIGDDKTLTDCRESVKNDLEKVDTQTQKQASQASKRQHASIVKKIKWKSRKETSRNQRMP